MRIAVVGSNLRYLCRFRSNLILKLQDEGHDVLAATSDGQGPEFDELSASGCSYKQIPNMTVSTNPFLALRAASDLRAALEEFNVDRVFAYGAKPILVTALAVRRSNRKIKWTAMFAGLGIPFTRLDRFHPKIFIARMTQIWMIRALLHEASAVVVQNEQDATDLRRWGGRRLSRVPIETIDGSGVNLSQFELEPNFPETVAFVFVGRLLKSKGISTFLEAARKLTNEGADATFHVVGSPDENPDAITTSYLQKFREVKSIKFHGHVADVETMLKATTVFVLPSYYREGVPRSGLEALAVGRPIIAADEAGTRELIRPDQTNGSLVPARDASRLALEMGRYVRGEIDIYQQGRASRAYAESRFDDQRVNQTLTKIILSSG